MKNSLTDKTEWPALDYNAFKSTAYLLHMGVQIIGKLKLFTPFEAHWSNVALWLTPRGLTSGLIPYQNGAFSLDIDLLDHKVSVTTSWGVTSFFNLTSMSVAQFYQRIFTMLTHVKIQLQINTMPQEIPNPIAFDQDTTRQHYDKTLVQSYWRILLSSYWVMKKHHSRFDGESPPIGLMWGTFDLRDARYNGQSVATTGINAGYIRRNAMNEEQVEIGWWAGNEAHPEPAYFCFIYPQPAKIEEAKIKPAAAYWDATLMEFILNYKDVCQSADPAQTVAEFFESTYQLGTQLAGWRHNFLTAGEPV